MSLLHQSPGKLGDNQYAYQTSYHPTFLDSKLADLPHYDEKQSYIDLGLEDVLFWMLGKLGDKPSISYNYCHTAIPETHTYCKLRNAAICIVVHTFT